MVRDGTNENDQEQLGLFYIIAGNCDLFKKREAIYDFDEHMIRLCLYEGQVDICLSSEYTDMAEPLFRKGVNHGSKLSGLFSSRALFKYFYLLYKI